MRFDRLSSAAAVVLLLTTTGCHSYAYYARGPGAGLPRVAVDEHTPHEETRWSVLWGTMEDVWQPIGCKDSAGNSNVFGKDMKPTDPIPPECVQAMYPLCDGNGAVGRVEVSGRWFTVPMLIITLGILQPMRVKAWCATGTGPGVDPGLGPAPGPLGPTSNVEGTEGELHAHAAHLNDSKGGPGRTGTRPATSAGRSRTS